MCTHVRVRERWGPCIRAAGCAYHGLLIRGAQSWINRAKGGGGAGGGRGAVASSFLILEYVDMYHVQHILHIFYERLYPMGCEDSFPF